MEEIKNKEVGKRKMEGRPGSFSLKKIAILACVLILPGFCYYLLQEKGENRYKSLPIYGEKSLSGTYHSRRGEQIPDTAYHAIESFQLFNTKREKVVFNPDSGVSIISLFYTGNKRLSDAVQQAMKKVALRFERNAMVHLYSITIDPEQDNPVVLAAYEQKWGQFPNWSFLRADSVGDVLQIARDQFLLNVVYDPKSKPQFTHSSQLILVDSKRHIRGYYDALIKEDIDKLVDETTLLLTEEYRDISVKRYER